MLVCSARKHDLPKRFPGAASALHPATSQGRSADGSDASEASSDPSRPTSRRTEPRGQLVSIPAGDVCDATGRLLGASRGNYTAPRIGEQGDGWRGGKVKSLQTDVVMTAERGLSGTCDQRPPSTGCA